MSKTNFSHWIFAYKLVQIASKLKMKNVLRLHLTFNRILHSVFQAATVSLCLSHVEQPKKTFILGNAFFFFWGGGERDLNPQSN